MKNRYKIATLLFSILFLVFLPHTNLLNQIDSAFSKQTVLEKGLVKSDVTTKDSAEDSASIKTKTDLIHDLEEDLAINNSFAVSIYDLNRGTSFGIDEDTTFQAASVMKLVTAATLLQKIDQGNYKLSKPLGNRTIEYQLEQMINQSNNDSWDLINNLLSFKTEQTTANQMGITGINVGRNQMTSSSAKQLLLQLYKGQVLSTKGRDQLFSYMQNTESENRISKAVPDGVTFYHKTGNFDHYIHDAAIIIHPKNPFILVIFTHDDTGTVSEQDRYDSIATAAKDVYRYFSSI